MDEGIGSYKSHFSERRPQASCTSLQQWVTFYGLDPSTAAIPARAFCVDGAMSGNLRKRHPMGRNGRDRGRVGQTYERGLYADPDRQACP